MDQMAGPEDGSPSTILLLYEHVDNTEEELSCFGLLYTGVSQKKRNPHKICMHYEFIELHISNQDKSTYFYLV